jgi:hypothetical protein
MDYIKLIWSVLITKLQVFKEPKVVTEWLALLFRFMQVPVSVFVLDSRYIDLGLSWCIHSLQANGGIVP